MAATVNFLSPEQVRASPARGVQDMLREIPGIEMPRTSSSVGGTAQIEGSFTQQEAKDLANVLKYGALPLTLEVAEVTSISPTLGEDQLLAVQAELAGLDEQRVFAIVLGRCDRLTGASAGCRAGAPLKG